jgi:hypothetical protein
VERFENKENMSPYSTKYPITKGTIPSRMHEHASHASSLGNQHVLSPVRVLSDRGKTCRIAKSLDGENVYYVPENMPTKECRLLF